MEETARQEGNGKEKPWLDYKKIKQESSFREVLTELGLLEEQEMEERGAELIGYCPLHEGKAKKSFSVNTEKGIFQCFACKAKGNILDFVQRHKSVSVREAAEWLQTLQEKPTVEEQCRALVEEKDPTPEIHIPEELTQALERVARILIDGAAKEKETVARRFATWVTGVLLGK